MVRTLPPRVDMWWLWVGVIHDEGRSLCKC